MEGTVQEREYTQVTGTPARRHTGSLADTVIQVINGPNGDFVCFSAILLLGYGIYSVRSGKFNTSVRTNRGTEIKVTPCEEGQA